MANHNIIDLNLTVFDYGCIHVAVTPLGELNAPLFSSIFHVLNSCAPFQLTDPKQFLNFKFLSNHPRWATGRVDWSSVQVHKQILGVLGVCQCLEEREFHELARVFNSKCRAYPKMQDCRCIVFGPTAQLGHLVDIRKGFVLVDLSEEQLMKHQVVDSKMLLKILADFAYSMHGKLVSMMKEFNRDIAEMDTKLKPDHILLSPFEIEPKLISRIMRKGRAFKYMGDLCLLSGQFGEATIWYNKSVALLKSRNDHLWIGATLEASACAAVIMKHHEELSSRSSSSSQSGRDSPEVGAFIVARKLKRRMSRRTVATTTTEKSNSVRDNNNSSPNIIGMDEVKVEFRDSPLHSPIRKQNGGHHFFEVVSSRLDRDSSPFRPVDTSSLPQSNGSVSPTSIKSGEVEPMSVVLQPDESMSDDELLMEKEVLEDGSVEDTDSFRLKVLDKDYPTSKYWEALRSYVKAKPSSAVMYIEALLRFARYLADRRLVEELNIILIRSSYNRNILSTVDRVGLLQVIAGIYDGIGFHRKAAMFMYLAGLDAFRVVKDAPERRDYYSKSHDLLLKSLHGYQLTLEHYTSGADPCSGWGFIQAYLLQNLILLTDQFSQYMLVIRYACYLLQGLYKHLSEPQLSAVIHVLSENTKKEDSAYFDRLFPPSFEGPPLPLKDVPRIDSFVPQELSDSLYPHCRHGYTPPSTPTSGPFIVSTLQYLKKEKTKEVLWVSRTPGEIFIAISNPLPFRVKVEDLRLWAESDNIRVQTVQSSLTLPPGGESQSFNLIAIPHGTGELRIRGYKAKVFGIQSACEVQLANNLKITVLPCLPSLHVRLKVVPPLETDKSTFDQPDHHGPIKLFDGETCNLAIVLENGKESPVTEFLFKLQSEKRVNGVQVEWSEDEISSIIPLALSSKRYFNVKVTSTFPENVRISEEISDTDGMNPSEIAVLASSSEGRRLAALDLPTERKLWRSLLDKAKPGRRTTVSRQSERQLSVDSMRSKSSTLSPKKKSFGDVLPKGTSKKKSSLQDPLPYSDGSTPPFLKKYDTISYSSSHMSLNRHSKYGRSATPTSIDSSEDTDSSSLSSQTVDGLEGKDKHGSLLQGEGVRVHPLLDIMIPPKCQEVSSVFEAEFSSDGAKRRGYYRKTLVNLHLLLQPTFVFCKFDVTPSRSSSSSQFIFYFTALNCSSEILHLHLNIKEGLWNGRDAQQLVWTVEPGIRKGISLSLKRFSVVERGNGEASNIEEYCKHITSLLALHWTCKSLNKQGSTSIQGFRLPPDCLSCLRPAPVLLKLAVNGEQVEDGRELKVFVGRPLAVSLTVTNNTGSNLPYVDLEIKPQLDKVKWLDAGHPLHVTHSSSLRARVPQLSPGQQYTHNTTLYFLYSGAYQLQTLGSFPQSLLPPTPGETPKWNDIIGVKSVLPEHVDMGDLLGLSESTVETVTALSNAVQKRRSSSRSKRSPSKEGSPSLQPSAARGLLSVSMLRDSKEETIFGPTLDLECNFITK